MKVREGVRIGNIACLLAFGVNAAGHREILGVDLATVEHGAGRLAFFRSQTGAQLVISDDHPGPVDAANHLDHAGGEIVTFTGFPKAHWRQIWSNNPQERLNKEIRRRANVVGISPTRPSVVRRIGALHAEHHDEWPSPGDA